ncbi:MAG: hypothetical protein R2941_20465 [Desulfobacterales bacterium]
MTQYTTDTYVRNGRLEIENIPLPDNMKVRVVVIPKVNLSQMSFAKVRELTKNIKGNLSDDIDKERGER